MAHILGCGQRQVNEDSCFCRRKMRMSGLCKVEMSAFPGTGSPVEIVSRAARPPEAVESVFFARLMVVECHQSFEVPDANIEFAENSICDSCRACRNLPGQFTGAGPRAI